MKLKLDLKYIYQRKGYDIVYYQRIVPKDLRSKFSKSKINITLPTTDLSEASILAKQLAAKHDRLFRQLRGEEPLTDSELLQNARDLKNLDNWSIPVSEEEARVLGRTIEDIQAERAYLAITDMADEGNISAELLLKNYKQVDEVYLEEAWREYYKIKKNSFSEKELHNKRKTIDLIISLSGNKPVRLYKREDARKFRDYFQDKNKIPTGKRNQTRLQGIFSFAINEYDLDIRNPFSSLEWTYTPSKTREPFTQDELLSLVNLCKEANDALRWCIAIQIETGARISEIIGLKRDHIVLDAETPHIIIKTTASRRLKNKSSERNIPLVGFALWAAEQLKQSSTSEQAFPKYDNGMTFKRDHATNAINKWLKAREFSKTTHGLRHSMSDRLRDAGCPLEIIESILGHASTSTSMRYGTGYSLEVKAEQLRKVALSD